MRHSCSASVMVIHQAQDVEESTGIYEHAILEDIVWEQWFPKKKKADGIIYGVAFNPIPIQTITLVFTAVCP